MLIDAPAADIGPGVVEMDAILGANGTEVSVLVLGVIDPQRQRFGTADILFPNGDIAGTVALHGGGGPGKPIATGGAWEFGSVEVVGGRAQRIARPLPKGKYTVRLNLDRQVHASVRLEVR